MQLAARPLLSVRSRGNGQGARAGSWPVSRVATICHAEATLDASSRRSALIGLIGAGFVAGACRPALAVDASLSGLGLPSAGIAEFPDFVLLQPNNQKTPALRAGVIKEPYSVALPPSFKEAKISNTLTGNFCMPNCGEPWVEFVYEGTDGRAELMGFNLVKLTNKKGATVKDLGSPTDLLTRIGPYISGTYLDEEDVLSAESRKQADGLEYYLYETYAQSGTKPPHCISTFTVKGDVAFLFMASATDRQWPKAEAKLRAMVDSFVA